MQYLGHRFRRVDTMAARLADPNRDRDCGGYPIPEGRFVIVSKKKAPKNNGYVNAESIQQAKVLPGLRYHESDYDLHTFIYGKASKQTRRGRFFWIPESEFDRMEGEDGNDILLLEDKVVTVNEWHIFPGSDEPSGQVWFEEYWTYPIYMVKDGNVFRASYHDWRLPKETTRHHEKA